MVCRHGQLSPTALSRYGDTMILARFVCRRSTPSVAQTVSALVSSSIATAAGGATDAGVYLAHLHVFANARSGSIALRDTVGPTNLPLAAFIRVATSSFLPCQKSQAVRDSHSKTG